MRVHVYTVCHNEEVLLPYFLRHYGAIADEIVVYDDDSTDASREIVASCPRASLAYAHEIAPHTRGTYSEMALTRIRNNAYKRSRGRAEWVIVVDVDEFLYHPRLVDTLWRYHAEGITLPRTVGYDMVSEGPPRGMAHIYDEIKRGFINEEYAKRAVFDPMLSIRYAPGSHSCAPDGIVRESRDAELMLLHFRFLGEDYFVNKYATRQSRMSAESRARGWGMYLTIPSDGAQAPLFPASEEDLRHRYRNALSGQRIGEVLS